MNAVAVFPSNREVDDSIIESLPDCDIAIVQAPGFTLPKKSSRLTVLTETMQNDSFGSDVDLLGHGSASLRNYGVWWAYHQGYDLIINLDDDCWPEDDFVQQYTEILTEGIESIELTGSNGWVSTLHQPGTSSAWYPRGFPYEHRMTGHKQTEGERSLVKPVVHMGLWSGTLDLNAVDKLFYEAAPPGPLSRQHYVTQNYLPICAMNFACLREWAAFIYQIPWTSFDTTLPLHRYDDIIGGIVTAALARLGGSHIGFGPPFVDHRKKDDDLLAHAAAENMGNVFIGRLAELLEKSIVKVENISSDSLFDRALLLFDHLKTIGSETELKHLTDYVTTMYTRWLEKFV